MCEVHIMGAGGLGKGARGRHVTGHGQFDRIRMDRIVATDYCPSLRRD